MNTGSVKAEIYINFNYSIYCSEFVETIVNNIDLLKAEKSDKKYSFNNKMAFCHILLRKCLFVTNSIYRKNM